MEIKTFIESLKFVAHAQAVRDVRYYLNGVLFEFDERSLHLVGTDGHRMAVAQVEYTGDVRGQFIAPTDSVKQIIGAFKTGKKGEISFKADDKKLELTYNDVAVSFDAIDGKFPDWRRVVVPADRAPGAFPYIDPEYLASACKALAQLCGNTRNGARPITVNANGIEPLRVHPVEAPDLAGLSQAFAIIMPRRH